MTIECLQSVHSIIHDNRMFAERAFYCLPKESVKVNGLASLCRFINCFQQLCNNQSLLRFYSQRSALGYCIVEICCLDILGFMFCAMVERNMACTLVGFLYTLTSVMYAVDAKAILHISACFGTAQAGLCFIYIQRI